MAGCAGALVHICTTHYDKGNSCSGSAHSLDNLLPKLGLIRSMSETRFGKCMKRSLALLTHR